MGFRLVPKSVTLNGVMAVALRYFTDFAKPTFQHLTASICIFYYVAKFMYESLLYFVVCVRCRP